MKTERFMLDDAGELIDIEHHQFIEYGEEVCELLNQLNDENEQLKEECRHQQGQKIRLCNYLKQYMDIEKIRSILNEGSELKMTGEKVCRMLETLRDKQTIINNLKDENKKLKQYIYDNLDEDVCDACMHRYLTRHLETGEYSVARCKKGYDECSKGTVKYCNDFKFKELI